MAVLKFSSSSEDILKISVVLLEVDTFTLRLWGKIYPLRASNSDRGEYVGEFCGQMLSTLAWYNVSTALLHAGPTSYPLSLA